MARAAGRAAARRSAASTCTWSTARRWRSTTSCGSRCDDDELALRVRASGARLLLCTHTGHPVAARGRRHADRQRRRDRAAGERRPHARSGTRCIDLDGGEIARRRARRAGLRLARAGGVDARGRAARAVRRDDRDRLVDDVPGGRAAARARARRATTSTARRCRPGSPSSGAGWADGAGGPAPADDGRPGRLAVRHARCSRRGCGSTRTSTATSPATTASWRARRARASASCPRERFAALVDEALREGFAELYLTGGEPFVHPRHRRDDRVRLRPHADRRADERDALHRPPARRARAARRPPERSTLQSSIDGARAATHDRWRGAGSWARAMDGPALRGRTSACRCASR